MPTENGNNNGEHDVSPLEDAKHDLGNRPLVNSNGEVVDRFLDEGTPVPSRRGSLDISSEEGTFTSDNGPVVALPWEPSGIWWKDMLYFVGPGKFSKQWFEPKDQRLE